MALIGRNAYPMQSFLTTTATKLVLRCHHLKLCMVDHVRHLWCGPNREKDHSLTPPRFKMPKKELLKWRRTWELLKVDTRAMLTKGEENLSSMWETSSISRYRRYVRLSDSMWKGSLPLDLLAHTRFARGLESSPTNLSYPRNRWVYIPYSMSLSYASVWECPMK